MKKDISINKVWLIYAYHRSTGEIVGIYESEGFSEKLAVSLKSYIII